MYLTCITEAGFSSSLSDESLVSELSAGFVLPAVLPSPALGCFAVARAREAFEGTAVA